MVKKSMVKNRSLSKQRIENTDNSTYFGWWLRWPRKAPWGHNCQLYLTPTRLNYRHPTWGAPIVEYLHRLPLHQSDCPPHGSNHPIPPIGNVPICQSSCSRSSPSRVPVKIVEPKPGRGMLTNPRCFPWVESGCFCMWNGSTNIVWPRHWCTAAPGEQREVEEVEVH